MRQFIFYIEVEYSEKMELLPGQNWFSKKYDFSNISSKNKISYHQNSNLFEFTLYEETPAKANERVEKLMSEIMVAEIEIIDYENCGISELVPIKLQA